jgi:hypothetical protein
MKQTELPMDSGNIIAINDKTIVILIKDLAMISQKYFNVLKAIISPLKDGYPVELLSAFQITNVSCVQYTYL